MYTYDIPSPALLGNEGAWYMRGSMPLLSRRYKEMSKANRKTRMVMVTVPAGACGATMSDAKKLQDRIISALSRWLHRKDYSVDLLAGVSDIDIDKGAYSEVRHGRRGRPGREQTIIPGHEYIPDPDPHIHIIMSCCPGATVINALIERINHRIPAGYQANLQDVADEWSAKKHYVVNQSRYMRVIEQGDPAMLPHGRWQFSRYGRGKSRR